MLKGSFSSKTLRLLDWPDLLDHVDQKLLFSVGDGYFSSAHLPMRHGSSTIAYRKVDTTIVDLYVAISIKPSGQRARIVLPESLYSMGSVLASVDLLSELVLLKTPG